MIFVLDFITTLNVHLFTISSVMTGIAFLLIGWFKAFVNQTSRLRGILETVLLGASAATVAFFVGRLLESII